jgi:peptide/nickel transport system permease protein
MASIKKDNRVRRQFFKNKLAIIALCFIFLVIVIAIFAYPISPDNTANANDSSIELATVAPGFKVQMLQRYLFNNNTKQPMLADIFFGKIRQYEQIPIHSYVIKNDSIFIERYLDEKNSVPEKYALQNIMPYTKNLDIEKQLIKTKTYYLGTDKLGRDMLSRLLVGARVSLAVGFIAVLLSISIGLAIGSIAGYFGGVVDAAAMWLVNVIWAIPTLLLVFAITFALGKGFWIIFIAVGLTMWIGTARLIRGQVMSLKQLEYIQAARTMGFSHWRIIVHHILPNVIGPTIVMAASNFATAILIEAGLSFLGVGVQPPVPSWGLMIKENYNFLITNKPLLAILPGIAIMLLVLAFNILGNALRDAFDVKAV